MYAIKHTSYLFMLLMLLITFYFQTKKVAGKSVPVTQAVITSAQKSLVTTSAAVVTSVRTTTTSVKSKNSTPTLTVRVTAPRLVAQAEKNAATQLTSTTRSSTSYTNSTVSSRMLTKVVTSSANQTFAAKLTEASNPSMMFVNQGSAANKGRGTQIHGLPHVNVGPTSPQAASNVSQTSPKHHRPAPTASAPPNMQHYQTPGKSAFSGLSAGQVNIQSISEQNTLVNQARSPTPVIQHATNAQSAGQDEVNSAQSSSSIPTASEYSLFNSMAQQPMWRRENESQKPVNFAAVTGGSTVQAAAPPKFIEQEPPQVDASKAPGYKGTAVCSPVSSKTSSNSATPPNMPIPSGTAFQCFQEPLKSQTLPPIGSTMILNRPASQANQNDISNPHFYTSSDLPTRSMQHLTHSDANIYKSGTSTFSEAANTMLNMSSGDGHLLSSYHQSSGMQHMNYSQPQQTTQGTSLPAVSMSRLNPKAPDFSSTVHTIPSKQGAQIYNGYVGNQNSNGMFSMSKTANAPLHRSNLTGQQRNWQLMQMQQPFTQQQSELISGMATGMTLHSLARAAGTEILENGAELGVVNSSPAMSPNLPGPHPMHSTDSHYIEDRKQPQPIGTERARKVFNPSSDSSWMFGNDARNLPGMRWPGNNTVDRFSTMQRGQIYVEDIPHMMMDSFQVIFNHYLSKN